MTDIHSLNAEDLQDMAFYLQSLLQVMAVDGHLHPEEQQRVREYAIRQGYSKRFIDETMATVLTNKHMPRTPPRFHSAETAQRFLIDAVELARCDGIIHNRERAWLSEAARVNGIDPWQGFGESA